MELNVPISILQRQKFAQGSPMAPFRDDRNTPQAWKKSRMIANQGSGSLDALQQMVTKLSRQRRPFRGGFVPQDFTYQAIQPFQFYGIAPNGPYAINNPGTGYAQGDTITLVGGTLAPGSSATTFTIPTGGASSSVGLVVLLQPLTTGNYTMPPAYPAATSGGSGNGLTLTAVSSSDLWRTCSMRQGAIGLRSRFFNLGAFPTTLTGYFFGGIEGMSNVLMETGNYQFIFGVIGDFQQSFDQPDASVGGTFGSPLMLGAADTPTLISGIEETQGDYVCWPQVVLNAPDGGAYQAAFWLEIIDSPTSKAPYVHPNLKGQMFTDLTNDAFPTSTISTNNVNIIPVAIVAVDNYVMYIEQFLSGNLVNLFDGYFNNTASVGGSSGLAVGSKMCFRGDWTADALVNQYFYPGDVVRDVSPGSSTITGMTATAYICITYLKGTTAPSLTPTVWIPLAF